MKPLENIRVEYRSPTQIRVYATVQGNNDPPLAMYADKLVTRYMSSEDVQREALHACMDILGHRYGDGQHGPWQKVFWAYQHDIRRQVRKALH